MSLWLYRSCVIILVSTIVDKCYSETVMHMIRNQHYPAEKHEVKTRDGYLLTMYRMPHKETSNNRKVMLLIHGMTSAAPAYLTFGKKGSAAYKYYDAGYDIWIGNNRGNTYSRSHANLNPNRSEYWNFSWHEMGIYDLPAMIDYILLHTNQTKLAYVGHSQGSTSAFVMLSELPQYNKKISVLHAMTPPVIFKYKHPLFPRTMNDINIVGKWLQDNGYLEVAPHTHMKLMKTTADLCISPTAGDICKYVFLNLFGPSEHYYNALLLDILNHIPAGACYKQFIHYAQIIVSGKFQHYDHGPETNVRIYGRRNPPEYNLSNIKTKVHIVYGTNDWLVPPENIPILVNKLRPNVVAVSKLDGFNHIDVTYGRNIQTVPQHILKVMKQLNYF